MLFVKWAVGIKIPPHSGGYFIFGHSPTHYWRGTSALFIGLPATHLLLTAHKWVPLVEQADLITFLIPF